VIKKVQQIDPAFSPEKNVRTGKIINFSQKLQYSNFSQTFPLKENFYFVFLSKGKVTRETLEKKCRVC
jgi:hypothetical protein